MFKRIQTQLDEFTEGLCTRAFDGLPGFSSAAELAADARRGKGRLADRADAMIAGQIAWSGSIGLMTQIGGWYALPLTAPVRALLLATIRLRMCGAIAILGRHDLADERVRALVLGCLHGPGVHLPSESDGIKLGQHLAAADIRKLSDKAQHKLERLTLRAVLRDGWRWTGSARGTGRLIPIVGGAIGAGADAMLTYRIGAMARDSFLPKAASKAARETKPSVARKRRSASRKPAASKSGASTRKTSPSKAASKTANSSRSKTSRSKSSRSNPD